MNEYTVNQVADILNVEAITVRRYIKQGLLKATKHAKGFKFYYLISENNLKELQQLLTPKNK